MEDDQLKLIYIGTAPFAVPPLKRLITSGYDIPLVVSQPDRRKGRGRTLSPTPVKHLALESGLNVFQPENINSEDSISELSKLAPDVIVVAAYGQILGKPVLEIPKYGCVNIHASLLPELRGAAPINWAIVNGAKETGVTSMLMDEGMDTGDMLINRAIPIDDEIDALELSEKLSQLGSDILVETLDLIKCGTLAPIPQDDTKASSAPILRKSDGMIQFKERDAKEIHDMVRGFMPWPGAYTAFDTRPVKILKTSYDLDEGTASYEPGTVVLVTKESIHVAAKKGALKIRFLQPQSKRMMSAADFVNGYKVKAGARFEDTP